MNRHRTIFRRSDVPGTRIAVRSFEEASRDEVEAYAEALSRECAELAQNVAGLGRRISVLEGDARGKDLKRHRPADRSDPNVKLLEYDARNMADTLKQELPKGVGFALFLFDYGGKGRLTYLSTARREDMIRTIGAWLVGELDKDP